MDTPGGEQEMLPCAGFQRRPANRGRFLARITPIAYKACAVGRTHAKTDNFFCLKA